LAEAVVPGEALGDGRARVHTVSLLRPFRRRADRTARPDLVRMRTRKPCVRLRRRLFGWKVRFIKSGNPRFAGTRSQGNSSKHAVGTADRKSRIADPESKAYTPAPRGSAGASTAVEILWKSRFGR
jgi:hypothetical protein